MSVDPRALPVADERCRLEALADYSLLDSRPLPELDQLVELAATVCNKRIATVTLVDSQRQVFKARYGIDVRQTPRVGALCAAAIHERDLLLVPDASLDPRFQAAPLVDESPFIRFYAGMPLINLAGHAIGTLAVMDPEPGDLDAKQRRVLRVLAQQVMSLLESQRTIRWLGRAAVERNLEHEAEQRELNRRLERGHARLARAQSVAKIGSWEADLRDGSMSWSRETFRIFDVPPDQLVPTYEGFLELVHPQDRQAVDSSIRASLRERDVDEHELEHRRMTRGGQVKLVQQRWRVQRDAEQRPLRAFGTAQDITERRAEQDRILRLSRMHEVLSGVNQLIVRAANQQELFDGCCRIAAQHGQFGAAWIDLYDAATGRIRPVACDGVDCQQLVPDERHVDPGPGELPGLSALAFRAGRHQIAHDFHAERTLSPNRRRAAELGYHSGIALPLTINGEIAGTLALLAREAYFFDADEVRLLDELAADISLALDRLAKLDQIRFLAHYDVLTGLPNRNLLVERVDAVLETAKQQSAPLVAVVQLDLQRLHQINDTFGRQFGDDVLKQVADRLRHSLGDKSPLGRLGGDHFVFVLAGLRDSTDLAHAVQLVLDDCFGQGFGVDEQDLRVMAKAGVAVFPQDGDSAEALLRKAERALNQAKAQSARFLFYGPEMNAEVAATLLLESRLRTALDKRQFVLHYQPKFDSATGALTGGEGLIRWNDPDNGLVAPHQIIPLLEESGLILEVGEWVIHCAISDYQRWRALVPDPPRVAVNVSPLQLRQDDCVDVVRRGLAGAGDDDHGLDLEITESVLMTQVDNNIDKLDQIRQMGVRVAIDDFGTGYSSLLYLAKLPLDTLKIDRSFVIRMSQKDSDRAIVATIVSLAHQLGLNVVAEGVDAVDQARLLAKMQCDEMQGFLFSEALPAHAIDRLIQNAIVPADQWRRGFSMN
jgi:diguanylate cyclase (GGDEF)-like protein/PAS domain S-box-containing protein